MLHTPQVHFPRHRAPQAWEIVSQIPANITGYRYNQVSVATADQRQSEYLSGDSQTRPTPEVLSDVEKEEDLDVSSPSCAD